MNDKLLYSDWYIKFYVRTPFLHKCYLVCYILTMRLWRGSGCSSILLISYITELGTAWAPATIDSDEELAAIRGGQKELNDIRNYFIGGSTNFESGRIIPISNFLQTGSGNK